MSDLKITPGPWETLDLGEALIVQPVDKTLHPICLVDRQKTVFANAALIAAAPDLYEYLKSLVSAFLAQTHWDDSQPPIEIINARSALAKARGEL